MARMIPLHLGAMHPYEQVLTIVLAVGPFLGLGIVIAHRRRADAREEQQTGPGEAQRER